MSGPAPPPLYSTLGGDFIGLTICGALWGVSCSQTSQYFSTRHNDLIWIRLMVAVVWLADTVHQMLITRALYDYAVTHFGDYDFLLTVPGKEAAVQVILTLLIMVLVQGFYAYKIWRLSGQSLLVVIPICLLILAEVASAIGDAVIDSYATTWVAVLGNNHPWQISFSALACFIDVVITFVMCFLLHRNRTDYARTNGIINRVTAFTLSTNALTTVLTGALLVLSIAAPSHMYIVPIFDVITRLYANSLLAALNLRDFLTHGRTAEDPQLGFALSSFRARGFGTAFELGEADTGAAAPGTATAFDKSLDSPLEPWSARVSGSSQRCTGHSCTEDSPI